MRKGIPLSPSVCLSDLLKLKSHVLAVGRSCVLALPNDRVPRYTALFDSSVIARSLPICLNRLIHQSVHLTVKQGLLIQRQGPCLNDWRLEQQTVKSSKFWLVWSCLWN